MKTYQFFNFVLDATDIKPSMIGTTKLELMKSIFQMSTDYNNLRERIIVFMDITAPLYWWSTYDEHWVNTVANSCSTMHKIQDKKFTLDDFSIEHLVEDVIKNPFNEIIDCLNFFRGLYLQHKDKNDWWQMIQLLPSSYNQKRTIQLNYAVLKNMYFARRNHKLDCWVDFCKYIETLPYAKELICVED